MVERAVRNNAWMPAPFKKALVCPPALDWSWEHGGEECLLLPGRADGVYECSSLQLLYLLQGKMGIKKWVKNRVQVAKSKEKRVGVWMLGSKSSSIGENWAEIREKCLWHHLSFTFPSSRRGIKNRLRNYIWSVVHAWHNILISKVHLGFYRHVLLFGQTFERS